jgi:regulator of sirC expression with transglutaminase-like and TPR domain
MSLSRFPYRTLRVALLFAAAQCAVLSAGSALAADAAKAPGKPPTAAAVAARKADAERYAACMAKIDVSAKDAFDDADSWAALGGGAPAKHCAAAALLKMGFAEDAATRLQDLAMQGHQDDEISAGLLEQAARAWVEAKNWDNANGAVSAALRLTPKNAALWLSRARIRARAQNYGLAVDDATEALKLAPKSVEARVVRGSAYRFLDALDLALADLDAAVKLSPADPSARLERGIVHRLMKHPDLARADWAAALAALPEDSPMVEDVRRNIELLEFPEAEAKQP